MNRITYVNKEIKSELVKIKGIIESTFQLQEFKSALKINLR